MNVREWESPFYFTHPIRLGRRSICWLDWLGLASFGVLYVCENAQQANKRNMYVTYKAVGRKKDEMNGKINQNNIISFFILAQDQNEGNQANLMFNQQVEIYIIILYVFVLYSSFCYSHFIYQPSQLVLLCWISCRRTTVLCYCYIIAAFLHSFAI